MLGAIVKEVVLCWVQGWMMFVVLGARVDDVVLGVGNIPFSLHQKSIYQFFLDRKKIDQ